MKKKGIFSISSGDRRIPEPLTSIKNMRIHQPDFSQKHPCDIRLIRSGFINPIQPWNGTNLIGKYQL